MVDPLPYGSAAFLKKEASFGFKEQAPQLNSLCRTAAINRTVPTFVFFSGKGRGGGGGGGELLGNKNVVLTRLIPSKTASETPSLNQFALQLTQTRFAIYDVQGTILWVLKLFSFSCSTIVEIFFLFRSSTYIYTFQGESPTHILNEDTHPQ